MTDAQAAEMILTLKEMAVDLERIRELMEEEEIRRLDAEAGSSTKS